MSDRDSIRQDAEDEAFRFANHEALWACRRCLNGFTTADPDWIDADGYVVEYPPCPECGGDALVVLDSEWESDYCVSCGRKYDQAPTADESPWCYGEDFVCPSCVRQWEADGGGYRECSGCGAKMLFSDVPPHGHTRGGSPCGQWQEVAS